MRSLFTLASVAIALLLVSSVEAKVCPKCGRDHLPDAPPKTEPPKAEPPKAESEPIERLSVSRPRFYAATEEIANEVDKILDSLEARYGTPKVWKPFPIYFRTYTGNGIAGYTSYVGSGVKEVVVYESLNSSVGGTLDHELTHAFWFYLLNSNFDLFLNEGLAQNSEYRRRESLRQIVYKRYNAGEFWTLDKLYGRNSYDNALRIYHEGFSVVDMLIGRGGSLWFVAFVDELTKTNDVDSALNRYYGYSNLGALQQSWYDYVESGQNRNSLEAVR